MSTTKGATKKIQNLAIREAILEIDRAGLELDAAKRAIRTYGTSVSAITETTVHILAAKERVQNALGQVESIT